MLIFEQICFYIDGSLGTFEILLCHGVTERILWMDLLVSLFDQVQHLLDQVAALCSPLPLQPLSLHPCEGYERQSLTFSAFFSTFAFLP